MKRMHLHVAVQNLDESIGFYSALFGSQPTVRKPDYAKWMLEDPRINFAISARGAEPGLDHLGMQVDAPEELAALRAQLRTADMQQFDEGETTCCYARADKSWVKDPSGIAWEAYYTMGEAEVYGKPRIKEEGACCGPKAPEKPEAVGKSTCSTSAGSSGCC
jgi:lactoylglutathione lyase